MNESASAWMAERWKPACCSRKVSTAMSSLNEPFGRASTRTWLVNVSRSKNHPSSTAWAWRPSVHRIIGFPRDLYACGWMNGSRRARTSGGLWPLPRPRLAAGAPPIGAVSLAEIVKIGAPAHVFRRGERRCFAADIFGFRRNTGGAAHAGPSDACHTISAFFVYRAEVALEPHDGERALWINLQRIRYVAADVACT